MTILHRNESKSNGYTMVTAVVASGDVTHMRKPVAELRSRIKALIISVKKLT